MADSDSSTPTPPLSTPLSSKKETTVPIGSKIAELTESRAELLTRIQGLKQDLQSWRSKLDTQVKTYRDELSDLKKSLNVEVDQLKTEFQDLRTTLQQQQDDVTASLKNLGLHEISQDTKETANSAEIEKKSDEVQPPSSEEHSSKGNSTTSFRMKECSGLSCKRKYLCSGDIGMNLWILRMAVKN